MEFCGLQESGFSIVGLEDEPPTNTHVEPYLIVGPKVKDRGSMSLVWVFNSEEYSSMIEFSDTDTAFNVLDGIVDLWGAYNHWVQEMFESIEEDEG